MEQNLLQLEDIMDYYISSMPCADREDVSRGMLEAFARHALFCGKVWTGAGSFRWRSFGKCGGVPGQQ